MKFLSIFFQVLFVVFHRHFKNRQILALEFIKKLAEGRRLLPAVPSVRGKEIENDHPPFENAQSDFFPLKVGECKIIGIDWDFEFLNTDGKELRRSRSGSPQDQNCQQQECRSPSFHILSLISRNSQKNQSSFRPSPRKFLI